MTAGNIGQIIRTQGNVPETTPETKSVTASETKSVTAPETKSETAPETKSETAPKTISVNYCATCGVKLERDEVAITRKLINRGTHTFYCKKCLSDHFEISVENIDRIIERSKRQGCTLFS